MNNNLTALVSCFARCYHSTNYKYKIFDDYIAKKILTEEEYQNISKNMQEGIQFFNKSFNGTKEKALRYVVDNHLSPAILARSIYTETSLKNDIKLGAKQYLIFASGYDTYGYRNNNIDVFEIDKEAVINDKINRLNQAKIDSSNVTYIKTDFTKKDWINDIINSKYDEEKKTFCSLLGISYYLTKEEFTKMIQEISKIISHGSTIVFDYPKTEDIKISSLANGANEKMKSTYSEIEIAKILEKNNMLVYEHLTNKDIDNQYFNTYNTLNPSNKILAPSNVNYCMAVKYN